MHSVKKCLSFLQIFSKKINGLKNLSFWDVFIEFYGFCPDSGLKDPDPKQCFFVLYDPLWAAALYLSKLLVRAPLFSISWSMASWRPPPPVISSSRLVLLSPPPPRPPRSSSCSRWRCLFASIYEDAATKLFNRIEVEIPPRGNWIQIQIRSYSEQSHKFKTRILIR